MKRTLFAALLAMTALPAHALDLSAMSDTEKAAFGAAVKDYLLEHPEVLVEAINKLEERQAAATAADDQTLIANNAKDLFDDGHSWVGGNPDGDVVIVEFMDYKCGYCKQAYSEVNALLKTDGNIRFIVKEFPILGPQSELGARFSVAVQQVAGTQAYAQVHDDLMKFRGEISMESLKRLAETRKLDAETILKKMNEASVTDVLRANYQLAERMNITGTPAFVIGDEMLRGYAPMKQMQKMVADQRG